MTREEMKELLPIMQAFAEGKVIEWRTKPSAVIDTNAPNEWKETEEIYFLRDIEHRVKPEPTYRPFKNAEECWVEMLKHQPFGWVKSKDGSTINKFMFIDSLNNDEVTIRTSVRFTYSELVKYYIFADGTPFGIRE